VRRATAGRAGGGRGARGDGPAHGPARPGRLSSLVRGREGDPTWERPALLGLLSGTLVLYLWDLASQGLSNEYYAAAVQAGTKSWSAFFWGSLDASNFITVDKPPFSLWVMELSGRIFGFGTWSMLVPQALSTRSRVRIASGSLNRNMSAATGVSARARPLMSAAAGPRQRRTMR